MKKCDERVALRVSRVSIGVNLLLSALKFMAGLLAHSGAMLSDAVHSASDVLSTLVVMVGVRLAGKEPDWDHPYGHERLESVAALLLAGMLALTGLLIGVQGVRHVLNPGALQVPGALALWAAALSIGVKEWMYRYTKRAAQKTGSDALMADAWHHRSDALSSVGSFLGIFGARLGFPLLDPLAAAVIALFILRAAFGIARDSVGRLTDRACDEEIAARMRAAILAQPGVLSLDELRTRVFGSRLYADVAIGADSSMTLYQAHAIAEGVHVALEREFPALKHCTVHVNAL
ncbi:cation diffusion facilitator family transporter [Provencibacterium massiliense]|uniref:cation diffusion facilitator family transporter n=1 Tax=Provencibacterium massiliense TaxID=1841868 RepID=UPI0009A60C57|nr:cation diffusion facilitator family transporter [Provencibacterium massiliense]RGB65888.1 cation transporter [Harryflintia acetispora]